MEQHVAPVFEKVADQNSRYLWAAGISSFLLVHPLDSKLRDEWGQHQVMPAWQSNIGDRYISYGVNVALALSQLALDEANGVAHVRGLLFTTAFTHALKVTTQRERPDHSDMYSFPSGHTSAAFSTATSLAYSYGWKAGVPAFAMAVASGVSRVADDKHWASDVVAGAFIGIIWGRASYFENGESNKASQESFILPSIEKGVLALHWLHSF